MKKYFVFVIMAFLAVAASAQIEQGFRMGVRINGGASSMIEHKVYLCKGTFGYGAAFVAEYNFKPTFFIQSGVGIENIAYDDYININNVFYAQLPIHIGCRFINEYKLAAFFQAGPTFGLGLFGPSLHLDGDMDYSGHINYFGGLYGARRFDLGLGCRAGVEFRNFQISIGVNRGVTKVFPKNYGGYNSFVNLGFAYMF